MFTILLLFMENAALACKNVLKHYCNPTSCQSFDALKQSDLIFCYHSLPWAKVKTEALHGGSRPTWKIEVEQLTLTFWYGPTKKRW